MSNVYVDQGDKSGQDAAVLLLAAAEELELPASVVTVDSTGSEGARFSAPAEVVKKAGLKEAKQPKEEVSDRLQGPTPDFFAGDNEASKADSVSENKAPAKKTAAKKTGD